MNIESNFSICFKVARLFLKRIRKMQFWSQYRFWNTVGTQCTAAITGGCWRPASTKWRRRWPVMCRWRNASWLPIPFTKRRSSSTWTCSLSLSRASIGWAHWTRRFQQLLIFFLLKIWSEILTWTVEVWRVIVFSKLSLLEAKFELSDLSYASVNSVNR